MYKPMKRLMIILFALGLALLTAVGQTNGLTAKEIIQKADQKMRGESNNAEMKMTIIRPTWEREVEMKSWSKGDEYALILITAPAREAGTAFLKRGNEIWNWQPSIDRTIKLPPSMMQQSWMGSDFTNDDLVKQSSIVEDYTHEKMGVENIEGRSCWKIGLTPKEDAAVVWGKVITWVDQEEFMELKTEFYDEDGELINTIYGKQVKEMDGRIIPTLLEVHPADDPGKRTVIQYLSIDFNIDIEASYFSVQNMMRLRL
jgi:outer membrane lipoprotein-sorting protein